MLRINLLRWQNIDDVMFDFVLDITTIGVDVTICYEKFYDCIEKSAFDNANEVFIGKKESEDYHG